MVSLYIGITDYDWFRFLSALPSVDEVNSWQPGGRTNFKALQPGELFLFKLHAPRNFVVGGGVFARADILPTSLAWDAFGVTNGAAALPEMRERIARYRNQTDDPHQDYLIGCRILTQPFFLRDEEWIPIPQSWSRHIQQGRTYDTAEGDGRQLWELIMDRIAARAVAPIDVPRYGEPSSCPSPSRPGCIPDRGDRRVRATMRDNRRTNTPYPRCSSYPPLRRGRGPRNHKRPFATYRCSPAFRSRLRHSQRRRAL
jgi:hypothetical protein